MGILDGFAGRAYKNQATSSQPPCDVCGARPAKAFQSQRGFGPLVHVCDACVDREGGTNLVEDTKAKQTPRHSGIDLGVGLFDPNDPQYHTDLGRIADSLEKLVALQLYTIKVPFPEVFAADPSGVVEAAIRALITEEVAEKSGASIDDLRAKLTAAGVDLHGDSPAGSTATGSPTLEDPLYYDCIRRLATYLNIPFDGLTDLEALARQHQWTRDTIEDTLRGVGLED